MAQQKVGTEVSTVLNNVEKDFPTPVEDEAALENLKYVRCCPGRVCLSTDVVLFFVSLPKLSAMSLSFSFQLYLGTKYEFVFYQVTCASLHEVECTI